MNSLSEGSRKVESKRRECVKEIGKRGIIDEIEIPENRKKEECQTLKYNTKLPKVPAVASCFLSMFKIVLAATLPPLLGASPSPLSSGLCRD